MSSVAFNGAFLKFETFVASLHFLPLIYCIIREHRLHNVYMSTSSNMVSVGRRGTRQKLHGTGKRRNITTVAVDPTMKRFDQEILDPFLRSTASQLAVRDGTASSIHPLAYLIKAKT